MSLLSHGLGSPSLLSIRSPGALLSRAPCKYFAWGARRTGGDLMRPGPLSSHRTEDCDHSEQDGNHGACRAAGSPSRRTSRLIALRTRCGLRAQDADPAGRAVDQRGHWCGLWGRSGGIIGRRRNGAVTVRPAVSAGPGDSLRTCLPRLECSYLRLLQTARQSTSLTVMQRIGRKNCKNHLYDSPQNTERTHYHVLARCLLLLGLDWDTPGGAF
jgi:hypothetical protein